MRAQGTSAPVILTPDRRLRVFVSSTLGELEAERAAAREAIARLRLTPVLFETGARPHRPRDLYRAYVEQCDIFIGIYWQSYGWIAPSAKISGLEDEYRLAEHRPRLLYFKMPALERDARLEAMLQEITHDERLCYRFFSTPDDLRELIENDLAVLLTERFAAHPEAAGSEPVPAVLGDRTVDSGLPGGTVTLMFTDIEGSTRLLQELGETYRTVLADHHRLIRAAVQDAHGREVGTEGDAFLVVFERARDAVAAAVAAQLAIRAHPWPHDVSVAVRMGIHTGEPARLGDGYVGLDVHRGIRIAAAAHGAQILLSRSTRDLIEHDLAPATTLRDLGRFRLKDLQGSEHLYQVLHPDLPADFPRLRSAEAVRGNLRRALTTFVGREREMAEVKRLLGATSLLTIVGVGGVGKTRLALQVAADLATEFRDGAWVVELAPVGDPRQVPQAVAAALGVRECSGLSVEANLLDYLKARHLLLVLDNCEHVMAAVISFTGALLAAASDVRVLCTSRESLRIDGEKVWRIPSLSLPAARESQSLQTLALNEAVHLFVDRARAISPGFALTEANAGEIARICVRLDGIPLAIELAAARVNVLSAGQIAERLDDLFRLLAGGSRTAMPRHQTLRAAMDWSHDLLSEPERALLRRLSVFAGGWTLDAAEAVCADHTVDRDVVMDMLAQLLNKSLVDVNDDATPWYTMLETVRQYAQGKLVAAGEASELRSRHREWYLALSEEAEPHLRGPRQKAWLDRLEREWDNLRASLEWALEDGDAEPAARMAAALWRFWYLHGHLTTGVEWLEAVLKKAEAPTVTRAKVLNGAAVLSFAAGNYARAEKHAQQAVELAGSIGDMRVAASAQLALGAACIARGDCSQATALVAEALTTFQAVGDSWGQALTLSVLGDIALNNGQYDEALRFYEESAARFRQIGDAWGVALSERGRGFAARLHGDYDQAVSTQAASLALARELGDRTGIGFSIVQLGFLHWRQGEYARAKALLEEGLVLFREAGNRRGVADVLSVLGLVEEYQGAHARANEVLQESLEVYRAIGARPGVASILGTLGRVTLHEGDAARAVVLAEESVAVFREIGDRRGAATSLRLLGEAANTLGDRDRALRYAEESLTIFRSLGDRWAIGYALRLMAAIALARGDHQGALRSFEESLALHREHGDRLGIVKCLEGLVHVLTAQGHHERAARLAGGVQQLRAAIGAPRTRAEAADCERCVARLQEHLGSGRVAELMEEGRSLREERLLAYAAAQPDGRS